MVPKMFSSGEMREIEQAIQRKFGSGVVIPDAAATRVISCHARSEEELEKAIPSKFYLPEHEDVGEVDDWDS